MLSPLLTDRNEEGGIVSSAIYRHGLKRGRLDSVITHQPHIVTDRNGEGWILSSRISHTSSQIETSKIIYKNYDTFCQGASTKINSDTFFFIIILNGLCLGSLFGLSRNQSATAVSVKVHPP